MTDQPVAIVTGASQGIGAAIACRLAQDGHQVVAFDIDEPGNRPGHLAGFHRVDVTAAAEVRTAIAAVERDTGPVQVLCNNAGVSTMRPVAELTEAEWDANFAVNVKGVFLCTQAVLEHMLPRRAGTIINTASMAGLRGVPLLAHYAASKWAVIGFTKSVAIEVAPHGVRVNAVCPGYVRTAMQERELVWEAQLRAMTPADVLAEYIRMTPLGRIEDPADVADTVAFLASDASRFLTGVALPVTGGADLL
jgi:NAD(P)-dependent dehydrogenase (short-subunit alcohol dehydrogenase family)